jgi:hypothetical protein
MLTRNKACLGLIGTAAVAWGIFASATGDDQPAGSPVSEQTGNLAAKSPSGLVGGRPHDDDAQQGLIAELSQRPAGELLAEDLDDRVLVKALVAQLDPQRTLPGSAPAWEVAAHLANVTPDDLYPEIEALILRREIAAAVLDVLVGDVHLRDESIKLPLFARITADPEHPAFAEAFAALQSYFDDHDSGGLEEWRAAAFRYPQQTASSR